MLLLALVTLTVKVLVERRTLLELAEASRLYGDGETA